MRTEAPTSSESATYSQLLRAPGVTLVFAQSLTNVLGHSLQIFALSVLIYRQTGSAAWSTLAFAAGFLPQLVGGAVLTSLADRWPARPLLAASAAIRAALAVLLAIGGLSPGAAIGVVALVAMWQPVPLAAQSALVTRLLTGDLYVLGRSVFNLISSGAQLLGLALGGAVIAVLGAPATFLVAAAIHLLGMLASLAIRVQGDERPPEGRWRLGETWTGNLQLLRDHAVRRILLSWWVPITLLVGAEALVVAFVGESNGSPSQTGILLAAFPAGAAVGDVVVGRWLTPGQRRRVVPWLYTLVGAALLPLVWYPGTLATVACFALASAATAYQLGSQQAFLDAVPVDRRGLAFGLFGTGLMVGQGLGPVAAGALADVIGSGATMTILGMTVLASAVFLARLPPVLVSSRPRT